MDSEAREIIVNLLWTIIWTMVATFVMVVTSATAHTSPDATALVGWDAVVLFIGLVATALAIRRRQRWAEEAAARDASASAPVLGRQ